MIVTLTHPERLTSAELTAWSRLQQAQPLFANPYFRPEFTQAVALVRGDVEVAVLRENGLEVGFFPFQRCRQHVAQPVGGRLSDYQGLIAGPALALDPVELIRQCELHVWHFDHLLCEQSAFTRHHRCLDWSPYLDLSQGYQAYAESLGPSSQNELRQTLRKARKMAREIGPLRLEYCCLDERPFELLLQWKQAQYRRTGVTNVFAHAWTTRLLREIWRRQTEPFAGWLSVLFAGERPIAAHFGMRSSRVLHWWFPAYDPALAGYSPGRVLLTELARACPEHGITRLDLGRGVAPYKARAMSGATCVAEGSVDRRRVRRHMEQTWRRTRAWVRNSPLYRPARLPGRVLHRLQEWIAWR